MHITLTQPYVRKCVFFKDFISINRKYNLRKVMVNGDVPPKVKKDAHALILEFIRSRPPLKKVYKTDFLIYIFIYQ